MSKIMIYATTDKAGGNVENVWGYQMLTRSIDSSNKDAVEQAKADGWSNKAQDIIEQVEAEKLQAENKVMKGKLSSGDGNKRIKELEVELAGVLTDNAKLESELKHVQAKLAIYEETKDVNGDGVVSYDEMTNAELSTLLKQRDVEHNIRDGKDALIKAAKDSEVK